MGSARRLQFEVLVIGGGPAGLAAATRTAECRARVALVDDNFALGGQIWRAAAEAQIPDAAPWIERLQKGNVTILCGMRVFQQAREDALLAEGPNDVCELRYDRLVLATGARERFLPFPGWTLPNVFGAGGLQAMVKSGLPIHGKRVLVAGTGPLLLAVAAYLREHGAQVVMICEQASAAALGGFGVALLRQPRKVAEALRLKRALSGVPLALRSWPVAAHGNQLLEDVTISRRGQIETFACDYLACGFHLVPNTELAELLGCKMDSGYVVVDELQRTSRPRVFCAGEATGIGGLELSLIEGEIAGLAAAGQRVPRDLVKRRQKAQGFARSLAKAFRLRPELRSLASSDTMVCRCEDVPYSRLLPYESWRAAKLQTRCGMGPCQGRVCGPATEFLFQWIPDSVRPPVSPVRLASLAALADASESVHQEVTGAHG